MTSENLMEKVRKAPKQPGIYIMKDSIGNIIYIGKAKDIRNRVKSYFVSKDKQSPKVRVMVSHIDDIEFMITNNEVEALILESRLVQKHKPKYNIELKDDKAYPYITVTSDEYPRLKISRRNLSSKDTHYGPYTTSVNWLLRVLKDIFKIRDCKQKTLPGKVCLSYHMGRCQGPCEDYITKERYMANVERLKRFLGGHARKVIKETEDKMRQEAKDQHFEAAAIYRDQLEQLRIVFDRQNIVSEKRIDTDVIGIYHQEDRTAFNVLFVRNGAISGNISFVLDTRGNPDEMLSEFIRHYYSSHAELVPKKILIALDIEDKEVISEWLTEMQGHKVEVKRPKRGDSVKILDMSVKNARESYAQSRYMRDKMESALGDLKDSLGLPRLPRTMECFDISTHAGKDTVASMVRFKDGMPDKDGYRRFRIKSFEGIDDFRSMEEVLTRRYSRIKEECKDMPDLVVIDGGKGQLNIALRVFKDLDIRDQPVISLAKREEEVYVPYRKDPMVLDKDSNALLLLRHIRDEAHRFAIAYNRKLRDKRFVS